MRIRIAIIVFALTAPGAALADFQLSFSSWGDIPLCTSGRPNTVPNPVFTLTDVPAGTDTIELRLRDLDVPGYNHGGATLRMSASGSVPAGTFTYRSPCPPDGTHTYQWTATARSGNQVLGEATATRVYPE